MNFSCIYTTIKVGLVLGVFLLTVQQSKAQTASLDIPYFDEALRRGQLLGQVDSTISFNIRPVDARRASGINHIFRGDSLLFPHDGYKYFRFTDWTDKKGHFRLTLLPLVSKHRYNDHHPYGWQDGPMIPNKGWQHYVSGGVYARYRFLEIQFRPEYVSAQNRPFQNPPVRVNNIDMPDRFGTEPYAAAFFGQSFVKLHLGPIAVGLSNENIWFGPGRKNGIIMTNNAPGFLHFSLHSNKPIKTPIGAFEFQLVGGELKYSGFFNYGRNTQSGSFPLMAPDIRPNPVLGNKTHTWVSTGAVSYQPRWVPGLSLGGARAIQVNKKPEKLTYVLTAFGPAGGAEEWLSGNLRGRNQLLSLFGRYFFRPVAAEVYFEVGREDYWKDWEDLLTNPTHTTVWMMGIRKMIPLKGKSHWLELWTEVTRLQMPPSIFTRGTGFSFYTHSSARGWTNRGQVLGAGIGPGSNMRSLGVVWNKGYHQIGLQFERVVYHEDMFYTRMPFIRSGNGTNPFQSDYTKHFVDIGGMLDLQTNIGGLLLGARWHLLRTFNFQWLYNPFGGEPDGFRFPGIHVWSHNFNLYTVYRF